MFAILYVNAKFANPPPTAEPSVIDKNVYDIDGRCNKLRIAERAVSITYFAN